MALININRDPSEKDLKWFTLFWFPLFAVAIGFMLWWKGDVQTPALVVGAVGIVLGIAGFAIRPLGRMIWIAIMTITYPIGWVLSHVILFVMYYIVLTPIGLVMRMLGNDPMSRKIDRDASTYWIEHRPGGKPERYYRQF